MTHSVTGPPGTSAELLLLLLVAVRAGVVEAPGGAAVGV